MTAPDPFPAAPGTPAEQAAEEAALRAYGETLRELCTWDPRPLLGHPIGMLHCPDCGCLVVAGTEHPLCDPDMCGAPVTRPGDGTDNHGDPT